jgi:hypothetical protein
MLTRRRLISGTIASSFAPTCFAIAPSARDANALTGGSTADRRGRLCLRLFADHDRSDAGPDEQT